jgi:hypothetical protein
MISLLCPTRNRPSGVRRLMSSARATAGEPFALEFVFYTDDDAPLPDDIKDQVGVVTITGPRIVLSAMWNACYGQSSGSIVMQAADDIVFRTPKWDSLVLAEFAKYDDRIVLVHGEDGIQGGALGTHSFLHRRWCDTLGYFTAPYFSCDYGDTWINDLADRIGRRVYVPEIVTEHLHPGVGKAPFDQTHTDRVLRGQQDNVGALWESLAGERTADAEKLREAIESFAVTASRRARAE